MKSLFNIFTEERIPSLCAQCFLIAFISSVYVDQKKRNSKIHYPYAILRTFLSVGERMISKGKKTAQTDKSHDEKHSVSSWKDAWANCKLRMGPLLRNAELYRENNARCMSVPCSVAFLVAIPETFTTRVSTFYS